MSCAFCGDCRDSLDLGRIGRGNTEVAAENVAELTCIPETAPLGLPVAIGRLAEGRSVRSLGVARAVQILRRNAPPAATSAYFAVPSWVPDASPCENASRYCGRDCDALRKRAIWPAAAIVGIVHARRDRDKRSQRRAPQQHGTRLQQLGFQQSADDFSVDQIERPHQATTRPANDLGARHLDLFAGQRQLGAPCSATRHRWSSAMRFSLLVSALPMARRR